MTNQSDYLILIMNCLPPRYTGRGVLKYTSDCAPNNGYYFIPLYDNGDYKLRIEPPNGWSFDPMEVSFDFNGKTDICSKQTDVNFVFKGFSIFGKVIWQTSTFKTLFCANFFA